MTLTIALPDNQQAALVAKARTQGLSAEQLSRLGNDRRSQDSRTVSE
jgi:hypothetical protein